MGARLIIALAALGVLYLLVRWFMRAEPAQAARILRWALFSIVLALLAGLALTGRLHWLFALGASVVPFLRRLLPLVRYIPLLRGLSSQYRYARGQARGPASTGTSRVQSRFLEMTLDHETGAMDGMVRQGRFQGRLLSQMTLDQLVALLDECAAEDGDSVALLETYLDRAHGDAWRERQTAPGTPPPPSSGEMTRDEAYEILGLEPGADAQAVIEAHRRLMQKLHPDRGGSTWLAAKLNQAKDLLLGR